ncbi:hypothetical protein AQUCO_04300110v1 [Aquilegia coerulea]|uniref:Uncharacterized protein n=1 Tax=Aquilegia coerulea TaxID=218851 RepID=A0A2G5CNS4_AQUCA|nr:hypothetical protein AQUCO_04300110v1 [Aquilegia coerulea]
MVNSMKLMQMLRKWQKVAAIRGKRISMPRKRWNSCNCNEFVTKKGYFVVYTMDQKRFMIPLKYLETNVFRELFRMSEEEFGLRCNGPITLPCDAVLMEYILLLVGTSVSKDLEKALELFRMSEEEFGLRCNRPITLPCDAVLMEYILSLVGTSVSKDLEEALRMFLESSGQRCSSSTSSLGEQNLLLESY